MTNKGPPPTQIDKFREAARDLGCDENEDRFKDALRKIAKAPPAPQPKPQSKGKRPSTKG